MERPQHRNVIEIVGEALGRAPGDRAAFLDEACRGDAALRAEAGQLVAATTAGLRGAAPHALRGAVDRALANEPPRRLGNYRIAGTIGRGGMGVVYRAVQVDLDRTVALKVLEKDFARHPGDAERFEREARTIAHLSHPNIVPVYDVGSDGGNRYYAMEEIEGIALDRLLEWKRSGGPPADGEAAIPAPFRDERDWIRQCCRVAAEVADALDCAHRNGVVHRDVKPANVLLRKNGLAVLTDFGVARRQADAALTKSGAFVGTFAYAAPEQWAKRESLLDPRIDVYALGVTLYELIALARPFRCDGAGELPRRADFEDPPPLLWNGRPVARDLETVCRTALEVDPARRYPTAAAFAADLRRFLAFEPVQARPQPLLDRCAKWVRRKPAQATALALAVLLVAALASFAVLQRRMTAEVTFEKARLSAARGDFAAALAAYERAEDLGYFDRAAVAVGRIEALNGMLEPEAALEELTRAEALAGAERWRSKLLLLRGTIGVDRWHDPNAGVERIVQALAIAPAGLGPADREFAEAHRAPDVAGALEHLERALAQDPAHHGALAALAPILLLQGEFSRAAQLLAAWRAVAPGDPRVTVFELVLLGIQEGPEPVRARLAEIDPPLPESAAAAVTAVPELLRMVRTTLDAPLRSRGAAAAALASGAMDLSRAGAEAASLFSRDPAATGVAVQVTLVPALAQALRRAAELVPAMAQAAFTKTAPDSAVLARFDGLIDACDLPVLRAMRASYRADAGLLEDAEEDVALAYGKPSLIPVGDLLGALRLGILKRLRDELAGGSTAFASTPAGAADRMTKLLNALVFPERKRLPEKLLDFMAAGAMELDDWRLVGAIAYRWSVDFPESQQARAVHARVLAEWGALDAAEALAREVLQHDPRSALALQTLEIVAARRGP